MRRGIRLKEWEPGLKRQMTPPANLIEESDGSISPHPVSITVSQDGFLIDPERPGVFDKRVIIMGDSVVECSFVSEGSRLSDAVERELRELGISTRVENGGRSGATILQLLMALQSKIIPMRPDKIVLMNGIIDSDALQFSTGLWSKGIISTLSKKKGPGIQHLSDWMKLIFRHDQNFFAYLLIPVSFSGLIWL